MVDFYYGKLLFNGSEKARIINDYKNHAFE